MNAECELCCMSENSSVFQPFFSFSPFVLGTAALFHMVEHFVALKAFY